MRLEATRGAGEDDPTQQDHCVRESQGNSSVKDHPEMKTGASLTTLNMRLMSSNTLVQWYVKLVDLLRQGKAIPSRLVTP